MPTARLLACALLCAIAALAAPAAASASSNQLSVIQDDRELLGLSGQDPAAVMAEMKSLGVDVVRTNVIYYKVYRRPKQRTKPSGFDASDPESPEYDWSRVDRLVRLARANGIQVLMTVTGPGPYFTTGSPSRCRGVCTLRPNPREFGKFAAAVAKRYSGRVAYYSIWNEPNLDVWLTPQQTKPGIGKLQTEGAIYRKLFLAGYKSIARFDRGRRNRVLFAEVAAIGEPLSLMRAALCLDERGRRFTGRQAKRHGCSGRVARLNIGGFAIHPYNFGAYGNAQSRTRSKTALPLAYTPRLHRLIDIALRARRITRRAPIFVTEFGYQSKPPDPRGLSFANQARYINESDRLFYADRRVAMVSQYELTDPPEVDQFNTGLRTAEPRGRATKPSYAAYRLPIVVTRRSAGSVEVYGQVRPGGSATVQIQAASGGGQFATVRSAPTNGRGFFRVKVSRSGAAGLRWRLVAPSAGTGAPLVSREATAGGRLRYRR